MTTNQPYCRCHKPVKRDILPPLPETLRDGNGKKIAVQCKRCTRLISCPCKVCGGWPDRMFDHIEACKPGPTPRTKRDAGPWLPNVPEKSGRGTAGGV